MPKRRHAIGRQHSVARRPSVLQKPPVNVVLQPTLRVDVPVLDQIVPTRREFDLRRVNIAHAVPAGAEALSALAVVLLDFTVPAETGQNTGTFSEFPCGVVFRARLNATEREGEEAERQGEGEESGGLGELVRVFAQEQEDKKGSDAVDDATEGRKNDAADGLRGESASAEQVVVGILERGAGKEAAEKEAVSGKRDKVGNITDGLAALVVRDFRFGAVAVPYGEAVGGQLDREDHERRGVVKGLVVVDAGKHLAVKVVVRQVQHHRGKDEDGTVPARHGFGNEPRVDDGRKKVQRAFEVKQLHHQERSRGNRKERLDLLRVGQHVEDDGLDIGKEDSEQAENVVG